MKTPAATEITTSAPDSAIVAGSQDADKLALEVDRFETGKPTRPARAAQGAISNRTLPGHRLEAEQPAGQSTALALVVCKDEARVDSRELARHFGRPHQSLFEMVKDYRADFERLGLLRFQTGKAAGGRPERFALLNEDQSYLLLTYSRNTAKVRALKVRLVQAFGETRRAAQMRGAEYLPTYRALHDAIQDRAAGSPNERFVHINLNKLVNRVAGVEAGQRSSATVPQQSMLIVAQAIAPGSSTPRPHWLSCPVSH